VDKPFSAMPDIEVLPAHFPIPMMGFLPINAFVIKAGEPVLVDTGMGIDNDEFMGALESVIDPGELKWIWLTHDDLDHTGNIRRVLDAAPDARLLVNALGALRMSTAWQVPMDRLFWINQGDTISAGDRRLTAIRPPIFDNPTTLGFYDDKSEAFFSADFFGAIVPSPVRSADDLKDADLASGLATWASADSPWVHKIEPGAFAGSLDEIRRLAPKAVFSAHLPPALGKTGHLLDLLAGVPASTPFATPDQTVLEQILAQG
jgi:hypothetical protein